MANSGTTKAMSYTLRRWDTLLRYTAIEVQRKVSAANAYG